MGGAVPSLQQSGPRARRGQHRQDACRRAGLLPARRSGQAASEDDFVRWRRFVGRAIRHSESRRHRHADSRSDPGRLRPGHFALRHTLELARRHERTDVAAAYRQARDRHSQSGGQRGQPTLRRFGGARAICNGDRKRDRHGNRRLVGAHLRLHRTRTERAQRR